MPVNTDEEALARAADWVRRLEAGGLTAADWSAFDEWLASDARHLAAFEDTQNAWNATAVSEADLDQILALAPLQDRPSAEEGSPSAGDQTPRTAWRVRPRVLWGALAATALFLIASVATTIFAPMTDEPYRLAQTGIGESDILTLDDGSIVELNTNTRLEYRYTDTERQVRVLDGEAYFDVESNAARQFEVAAGNHSVSVVGTAFNVKYLDQALRVSVIEGIVSVEPNASAAVIRLLAGESVDIGAGGGVVRHDVSPSVALAWRNGIIAFENQTLDEILLDVDRYFPEPLSLSGAAGSELYTGVIYIDDLDEVLRQLGAISSTDISFDDARGLKID